MKDTMVNNKKLKISWAVLSIFLYFVIQESGIVGNAAVLVLLLPIFFYIDHKIIIKLGTMEKAWLCYLIYGTLVTVCNLSRLYDPQNAFMFLLEYIIIFSARHVYIKTDTNSLIMGLRNFGIFIGILGVFEFIFKFPIWHYILTQSIDSNSIGQSDYRLILIFGRSIVSGTLLLLFWILLFYYPLKNTKWNLLAHAIVLFNILANKSRSCWIALVVVILMIMIKQKTTFKVKKKFFYLVIGISVFITGLQLSGFNLIGRIYLSVVKRVSGSLEAGEGQIVRIETMLNSFNYWRNGNVFRMIFGSGKNYDKLFLKENPVVKWDGVFVWDGCIDNQYLTTIHEFGLIGVIFIFFILCLAIKRIIKSNYKSKQILSINLSLLGLAICMFFYDGLNYALISFVFIFLLSISDKIDMAAKLREAPQK